MPGKILLLFAALLCSPCVHPLLAGDDESADRLKQAAAELSSDIAEVLEFLERIDRLHEDELSEFHRSRAALGSLNGVDHRNGLYQFFRRGRQSRVDHSKAIEDSNLTRQQIQDRNHRRIIDQHPERVQEFLSILRSIQVLNFSDFASRFDSMWAAEDFAIDVHSPFSQEDFKLLLMEIGLGFELLIHAANLPARQAGLETQILSYIVEQTINFLQALQVSVKHLPYENSVQDHPILKVFSQVITEQMDSVQRETNTNGSLLGLAESLVRDFTHEGISRFQRRLIATMVGIPLALNVVSFGVIGLTNMSEGSAGAVITATQILALVLDVTVYRLHWVQEARQRHSTQPRRISRALRGIMQAPEKCLDALAYVVLSERYND